MTVNFVLLTIEKVWFSDVLRAFLCGKMDLKLIKIVSNFIFNLTHISPLIALIKDMAMRSEV